MQSLRFILRHTPLQNGLFATLACSLALLFTAGPALAQRDLAPQSAAPVVASAQAATTA